MSLRVCVVAAGVLLVAFQADAQKAQIQIVLPERTELATEAPFVRSAALLSDAPMRNLLINGFPARLHYRIERWATGGWFDDIKAAAEWDVVVKYDALGKRYHVFRAIANRAVQLGSYETAAEAEEVVSAPFRAPISLPRRGQRTYYNLVLDIETLSLTELDEVERWLRGELKPAVRGKKNPGTAVSRGVRTLVVRLLGGEKRRYETRSGAFRP
ncbi:MAG TPA: hypothetical protein VES88_01150 [Gemmatimonadaceae bacterium]|nr:hypothetical protein [Gemmatimonadaceae bacterium]